MESYFADREEAGDALAAAVARLKLVDPVVLALPRGGVPVAAKVAKALHAPLDLLLVRKIGAPFNPELAVGAVVDAAGDDLVVDEALMASLGMTMDEVQEQASEQREEIARRRALYLRGRPPVPLAGRSVVVVDDGIATGATVRAALKGLRGCGAKVLVLAVPVAPPDTVRRLRDDVDHLVCLSQPPGFYAVGAHYRDFHQVPDEEVIALLDAAA